MLQKIIPLVLLLLSPLLVHAKTDKIPAEHAKAAWEELSCKKSKKSEPKKLKKREEEFRQKYVPNIEIIQKAKEAESAIIVPVRLKLVPEAKESLLLAAKRYEEAVSEWKKVLTIMYFTEEVREIKLLEECIANMQEMAARWRSEAEDLTKKEQEQKKFLRKRLQTLQRKNAHWEKEGSARLCLKAQQEIAQILEELIEVNAADPAELAQVKLRSLIYQALNTSERLTPSSDLLPGIFYKQEQECREHFFDALVKNTLLSERKIQPPWQLDMLYRPIFHSLCKPLPRSAAVLTKALDGYTPLSGTEEESYPILDQFVADMKRDPLALTQYVYNEIELVDSFHCFRDGAYQSPLIHRNAHSTFMNGQGSPMEQCALLVYLLRKAGYQAVFGSWDPYSLPRECAEKLLFTQIQDEEPLFQYPGVLLLFKNRWISLFPWLKEISFTEGCDLYSLMPEGYASADQWIERYLCNDEKILKHIGPEGNDSAGLLFIRFADEELRKKGYSLDQIGMQRQVRKKQFFTWEDCPRPAQIKNTHWRNQLDNPNFYATVHIRISSEKKQENQINISWYFSEFACRPLTFHFTPTQQGSHILSVKRLGKQEDGAQLMLDSSDPAVNINVSYLCAGLNCSHTFTIVKGTAAALCFNAGESSARNVAFLADQYSKCEEESKRLDALLSFIGSTYFEKCSWSRKQLARMHKVIPRTNISFGLAKFSPDLSSHTALLFPQVDMLNQTLLPDCTQSPLISEKNFRQFAKLAMVDGSSNEHQVLHELFADPHAISTVKLLQIAHEEQTTRGAGRLGFLRFQGENLTLTNSQEFKNFDISKLKADAEPMWKIIQESLKGTGQESAWYAYMTPGTVSSRDGTPLTPPSYRGIGSLIFCPERHAALISDSTYTMNGGFGSRLPENWWEQFNNNNLELILQDNKRSLQPAAPLFTPALAQELKQYEIDLYHYKKDEELASRHEVDLYLYSNMKQLQDEASKIHFKDYTTHALWDIAHGAFLMPVTYDLEAEFKPDIRKDFKTPYDTIADPIDIASGAFYIDEVDLDIPGPFSLQLRRNYNSQNPLPSILGYGWKLGLNPTLHQEEGRIYIAEQDGSVLVYSRNAKNAHWVLLPEENPQLYNFNQKGIGGHYNHFHAYLEQLPSKEKTTYLLHSPDGSVRKFEDGLLRTWTDHAGNYLSFSYQHGQLTRIESSNGSYLGFYFNHEGRISEAYTRDGRRVHYRYDSAGNLSEVVLPNDAVISYEYDHLHQLIREKKPHGKVLENWYDNRKVVRQCSPAGPHQTMATSATLRYLKDRTFVTDASGATTEYRLNEKQIFKIIDPMGNQIKHSWFVDAHHWFDAETETLRTWEGIGGWPRSLKSSVDQRGLSTEYVYDERGNPQKILLSGEDLTGSGEKQMSKEIFYNTLNLPIEEKFLNRRIVTEYDPAFPYLPRRVETYCQGLLISCEQFEYGRNGWLAKADRNGSIVRWTYHPSGYPLFCTQETGTEDPDVTLQFLYNHQGQCIKKRTLDQIESYEYDLMGNPYHATVSTHSGKILSDTYYGYNENNALIWKHADVQNTLFLDYNAEGHLKATKQHLTQINGTTLEDAGDAYTLYDYDACGRLVEAVDSLGVSTCYTYNPIGRVSTETREDVCSSFSYEPGGLVASIEGPGASCIRKSYTTNGLIKSETQADGIETAWIYDLLGRPIQETKDGRIVTIQHEDASHLETRIEGEFQETRQYDPRGNLIAYTDRAGYTWRKTYDGLNRLKRETAPNGETTTWNYVGDTVTCHLPNGEVAVERYEGGALAEVQTHGPDGKLLLHKRINRSPHKIEEICGEIATTTWTNTFGLPVRIQQGSKVTTHYYDPVGNCIATVDGEGKQSRQIVDAFGRVVQKFLADGSLLQYEYDLNSNLVSCTLPGACQWRARYDEKGRKIEEWEESQGVQRNHWEYRYSNDLLIQAKDPLNRLHTYEYDSYARLIGEQVENDQRSYAYDPRGLLAKVIEKGEDTSTIERQYDSCRRLVQEKIQLNGIVIQETQQSWSPSTRTLIVGDHKREYRYQGERLVGLSTKEVDINYQYGLDGALIKKSTPLSEQSIEYTPSALPHTLHLQMRGSRYEEHLEWTMGGKLAKHRSSYPKSHPSEFAYNARGHLSAFNQERYEFDPNGVLTKTSTFKVEEQDRFGRVFRESVDLITEEIRYDEQGQVIAQGDKTLEWDVWGRLTKIKGSAYEWTASYDAFGRRLKTSYIPNNNEERQVATFLYDPEIEFQEIGLLSGEKTFWILYGINSIEAITEEGNAAFLHHDLRNNLVAVATREGEVWNEVYPTPFGPQKGAPAESSDLINLALSYSWQSKRTDPTGLIWLGARYYDPYGGRFLSPDPISHPACLDLYAYANGDPINNVDLDGLFSSPAYATVPATSINSRSSLPTVTCDETFEARHSPNNCSRKYDLRHLGRPEMPYGLAAGYINGIDNDFEFAKDTAIYISDLIGGYNIHAVYSAKINFRRDLEVYNKALKYEDTGRMSLLHEVWNGHFDIYPNGYFIQYSHSRGTVDARNAALMYPENRRNRIIHVSIAPGGYIYSETCARVSHYRVPFLRDFIPYNDSSGAKREKHTIITLSSHEDAPIHDHSIRSPTYRNSIKKEGELFIRTKGRGE